MILFAILEWRNENIFMGHQSLKLDKPDSYLIFLKIIKRINGQSWISKLMLYTPLSLSLQNYVSQSLNVYNI